MFNLASPFGYIMEQFKNGSLDRIMENVKLSIKVQLTPALLSQRPGIPCSKATFQLTALLFTPLMLGQKSYK